MASKLEALNVRLINVSDSTQLIIPELDLECGVELNDALRVVEDAPADQKAVVDTLWFLFGRAVTVRQEGYNGNTILDYRETLPDDIAPLLVLDASARVRATYRLWDEYRGGVVWLPAAMKDYSPLTIHVWRTPGGKRAFKINGDQLIEGIAKTIDTKPEERWLIVHHKNKSLDVERRLRARLSNRNVSVDFIHWGAADATNAFADVPNIILAGTLFYRASYYEALGRAAAGKPSSTGSFASAALDDVRRGEHRHLILQALCRGAVRKCRGASCPPVNAYIIASNGSGIANELPAIFPQARVLPWQPVKTEARGKVGKAARFILGALPNGGGSVSFVDVMQHIGMHDKANFNRSVRRHPDFRRMLAENDVIEWPESRSCCFKNAGVAYFGGDGE